MLDHGVSLENVTIGHAGMAAVSGLSLSLPAGRTLALVGGNGSGKTTLLKTLAGLIPAISGSVSVLGGAPGKRALSISYHGQFHPNSFLLPLRSIDVVRMARFPLRGLLGRLTKEDEKITRDSLARMDAAALADRPVNSLSGGQRQRIFLAHTLARQADLLLLDEPTAGLDVPGILLYEKMIGELKAEGKTILVATHSIKEASLCDYVLLLASRVVAYGPPPQVMSPGNLLETFGLAAQFTGQDLVIVDPHHCHDNE